MEQVFINATVHENDKVPKKTIEIKRYVGNSDSEQIAESRLYECIKSCQTFRIGCYSVSVIPKKNCQIWLRYEKGQLIVSFLTDKIEEIVGNLEKDFLVNIVETNTARIEIELLKC